MWADKLLGFNLVPDSVYEMRKWAAFPGLVASDYIAMVLQRQSGIPLSTVCRIMAPCVAYRTTDLLSS